MLDIKFIRENPDLVKDALKKRGSKVTLDELLSLDSERRKLLSEVEAYKNKKNLASEEIGKLIKEGNKPEGKIADMKALSQKISEIDAKVEEITQKISKILYIIPNIPHQSLPIGPDRAAAKVVKEWGKVPNLGFTPRTHIEIGDYLGILDLERATKITGSNFVILKGHGARLERALINFMIDMHTQKHGYTEIWPPLLVNRASMTGTGQLPKLEEDMYRLRDDDLFLIPTAEVPVTNMHANEIIDENKLPIYYTAYTPCFRREAGSYGKDTKGLIRVHQFDKVEMVKFVKPETSYDELEKLLLNAEEVLQALGIAYRVVMLATGDVSFSAAKCYDIEAYAPGLDTWLEVSSCSNFEDFQARRANIKYRRTTNDARRTTEYVHTLNGSGVALARTVVAILESYQQKDGSVLIPEPLRPYMGGQSVISPAGQLERRA